MIKIKVNSNKKRIRFGSFLQKPNFIIDYIKSLKIRVILKYFKSR